MNVRDLSMQRNYFFLYAQVSQTDFAQNKNGSITAAVPIYNVYIIHFRVQTA